MPQDLRASSPTPECEGRNPSSWLCKSPSHMEFRLTTHLREHSTGIASNFTEGTQKTELPLGEHLGKILANITPALRTHLPSFLADGPCGHVQFSRLNTRFSLKGTAQSRGTAHVPGAVSHLHAFACAQPSAWQALYFPHPHLPALTRILRLSSLAWRRGLR